MNKRNLLLAFFLAISAFIYAQPEYAVGIKGGLNYYTIGDINSRGGSIQSGKPDEVFSPNKEMGTQFGVFLDVAFDKFFIRPEINFTTNKNNYDFPNRTSHWKASKMDFPILIGYKIYDPVAVYVGPSFSFFNDMTLEGANNITDANPINFEKTTTNFMIGLQVEFKRFGVDLRYEVGSKETEGEHTNNYQDFQNSAFGINLGDIYSYKPSQISLSLNIFLFRTNGDEIGGIFKNLFKGDSCDCLKQ